jgi:hypothetical protein
MTKPITDPAKTDIKAPNYSPEQTAEMEERYTANPTRATVDELADEFNKQPRSIIAKLSHMHIYVTPPRVTKSGTPIIKKETLVANIEMHLSGSFPSLVKSNKRDLEGLCAALEWYLGEENEI